MNSSYAGRAGSGGMGLGGIVVGRREGVGYYTIGQDTRRWDGTVWDAMGGGRAAAGNFHWPLPKKRERKHNKHKQAKHNKHMTFITHKKFTGPPEEGRPAQGAERPAGLLLPLGLAAAGDGGRALGSVPLNSLGFYVFFFCGCSCSFSLFSFFF